jgi:cobalamin biosynthesis protein CobD/CbiB
MIESIRNTLVQWNKNFDDRVKLQYGYALLAIILLVTAGLIGLINQPISVLILWVVFALAILFIVNAIAWALLKTFVVDKLPKSLPRTKK